jgi:hypothetical protein
MVLTERSGRTEVLCFTPFWVIKLTCPANFAPLVRETQRSETVRNCESHQRKRGITSFANSSMERRALWAGIPGNCIHITRCVTRPASR